MADLDHRMMAPPFVRLQSASNGSAGSVFVWELRIGQPNVSHVSSAVMHSLEHMLSVSLRSRVPDSFVLAAPMGCRTGLYMVLRDIPSRSEVVDLVEHVLQDILESDTVPLADVVNCGWASHHDLEGAQAVAAWVLGRTAILEVETIDAQPQPVEALRS